MSKLLTEFIGTFFLVLTIALAVIYTGPLAPIPIGVILMVMVYMGGPISGGQYNPAVTLGVFLSKNMPVKDVAPYMVVQIVAALAAAGLATSMTGLHPAPSPAAVQSLAAAVSDATAAATGGTPANPGPTMISALIVEILFTFALVLVVLNVACTPKCTGNSYFGAAIGLTVMAGAFAGGPISGGAFNPAVGIGLCTVNKIGGGDALGHVWLYIVGPLAGGVLAAVVYRVQHRKA